MIHRETYSKYPELGYLLFEAYSRSKKDALERKLGSTLLPWADKLWSETMHIFDYDPYPHGLNKSNTNNIEKLLEYLFEQDLISNKPSIEDIFVKESLEWTEGG
jgi:4,5-dihydroxyphthalate decarboxylase